MDELLERGLKVVPVTIWGEEVVIGFNPKELSRMFNLNSEVSSPVDLPVMMEKFETVLQAACRATRQIPEDHLDWESPERQRSIGQFTFHLFDRPDRALNAYLVGEYTNEDRGRPVEDVLGQVGFEGTALYGEDILHRIKEALIGDPPLDQSKMLVTYMGPKTAGEMLDLALGHSAHHLKQLYEYMSMIGIEPISPLGQDDFEGIAVPTELF